MSSCKPKRCPVFKLRTPAFPCRRKLPQELLFDEPTMPESDLLALIHQVQNEIYNCPKLFDTLLLETNIESHLVHRAYEYCKRRRFKFEIMADDAGFTLEFYHIDTPGKIRAFAGKFDGHGLSPDFIRQFAEKIFKIREIIKLRRKEKR